MPDEPYPESKRREEPEENPIGPGTACALNLPRDARVDLIKRSAVSHSTSGSFVVSCGHWFYKHLYCIGQPSKLSLQPAIKLTVLLTGEACAFKVCLKFSNLSKPIFQLLL